MVNLLEPCQITETPSYDKPDKHTEFARQSAAFLQTCAGFEAESKKHIYDAVDAPQSAYRVHAVWLSKLILGGQQLLLFAAEHQFDDAPSTAAVRDKTAGLVKLMYDWHGVPGSHSGEPLALLQSLRETAAGQILQEDW
jgi:hypothetical protein